MCWGCAGGLCHFFVFSLICRRQIKKEVSQSSRGEGLDGSATAEERDNYHRDAYENARNHASGPPAARG